jgi:hypothetical protein
MDEVRQEPDGTWTVHFEWCGVDPVTGIPTKDLADRIWKFGWDMERAGSDHYASSEY